MTPHPAAAAAAPADANNDHQHNNGTSDVSNEHTPLTAAGMSAIDLFDANAPGAFEQQHHKYESTEASRAAGVVDRGHEKSNARGLWNSLARRTITKLSHVERRVSRCEDIEDVELYVADARRRVMYVAFCVLLLGIPYLLMRRSERTLIRATHRRARYGDQADLIVMVKHRGVRAWTQAYEAQLVQPSEIRAFLRRVAERDDDVLSDEYHSLVQASGANSTMTGLVFEVRYRRYILVEAIVERPCTHSLLFEHGASSASAGTENVWILSRVEGSYMPAAEDFFEGGTDASAAAVGAVTDAVEQPPAERGDDPLLPPLHIAAHSEAPTLRAQLSGIDRETVSDRLVLYGENVLSVKVERVLKLFLRELLHPFFLFQAWAVVLWLLEEYYFYAMCILLTSLYSAFVEAKEIHSNLQRLAMLATEEEVVTVLREGREEDVSSRVLVPGDVMYVGAGTRMPCDGTLLRGSVLTNEASLTGESCPVRKSAWSPAIAELLSDDDDGDDDSADDDDDGSSFDEVRSAFDMQHEYSLELEQHDRYAPTPTLRAAAASHVFRMDAAGGGASSGESWARPEHVIYSGTNVLDARDGALVVVTRTRAETVRGGLVRDILVEGDKAGSTGYEGMQRDAVATMGVLAVVGTIATVWATLRLTRLYHLSAYMGVLNALDLVTIALPPALPATVTFGLVFAIKRLQARRMFVTRASAVTHAAWIQTMCFDKTGTLTEEGLDVRCVLPVEQAAFGGVLYTKDEPLLPEALTPLLASCHSLATLDGDVVGDEVDVKLFELSRWMLEHDAGGQRNVVLSVHDPSCTRSVEVLRLMDFKSELARMSVVVRGTGGKFVYTKGAPEHIASKCVKRSVPRDLHEVLTGFTEQGFRLIALASRRLESAEELAAALKQPRGRVERDLVFLGLAVLENRLKSDTAGVLKEIGADGARLRSIMVTGDHARTALSVSRQCGILSGTNRSAVILCDADRSRSRLEVSFTEMAGSSSRKLKRHDVVRRLGAPPPGADLVCTGGAFRVLTAEYLELTRRGSPDDDKKVLFEQLLRRCSVFARMSAADKSMLVRLLHEQLGAPVGMCGDGANDAGALREATVGVSLCDEEDGEVTASLAASLTSRITTIAAVSTAIKEGRAAAAASLAALKFMFVYSIVQLVSVICLYRRGSVLSDGQFLFVDLFLIIPLGVLMGQTEAATRLGERRPPSRLASKRVLLSALGQALIMTVFQLVAVATLRWERLLLSAEETQLEVSKLNDLIERSTTVSALFLFSNFQYLWSSAVFNIGPPFRRALGSNVKFAVTLVAMATLCMILLLWPPQSTRKLLSLAPLPTGVRVALAALAVLNLAVCVLLELFVERRTKSAAL